MAIVPNYYWPVAVPGSTTPAASSAQPPTGGTSSVKFNEVVAQITGDGTSTSFVVTHNLQLTTGELAELWPEVEYEPIISGAPTHWVIARATNTVTIGMSGTTALAFAVVRVRRPATLTR